jgi:hypothetical protein
MSRIYLIIAGIFVLAGLIAAFFAPVESMGAQEAFYARLLLVVPPLIAGTVISALAIIISKLEQLQENKNVPAVRTELHQEAHEDFNTFFAEKLHADHKAYEAQEPQSIEQAFISTSSNLPNNESSFEAHQISESSTSENKNPVIERSEEWRAPTVDEFLIKGDAQEHQNPSSRLAREGTFAGRSYRMYEDGSLEIDTDQSTIRFDSLDEFRKFVSSAVID